jgi:hypothetical protein
MKLDARRTVSETFTKLAKSTLPHIREPRFAMPYAAELRMPLQLKCHVDSINFKCLPFLSVLSGLRVEPLQEIVDWTHKLVTPKNTCR